MTISDKSQQTDLFGTELDQTLLPEDFPAKTYQMQESVRAWLESAADCGGSLQGLLASYDPATQSWKTCQHFVTEDLRSALVTLPPCGMTRSGQLYQRTSLEPDIDATGFGLLPTPTARDYKDGHAPRYRDGKLQTDTLGRAIGGPPNPQFTEWLMGFPIGHTDLKH
jgi:hypothetical protein